MGVYQADANGKAPAQAKAGDYVITGGGTYKIDSDGKGQLISNKADPYYTAPSKDGSTVNQNYTSKLNQIFGVDNVTTKGYDNARKLADAYYDNQIAGLEVNYNNNLANLKNSYNTALSQYDIQKSNAQNAYEKNRNQVYEDAYYNNKVANQIASNRGMTSAGQGRALNVSTLAKASQRASELTADRDTLINNINTEINRLSEQYNINRDTLKANFDASKLSAKSTADLQYMQACLEADDYNADLWNGLIKVKAQMDFEAGEAQKQRDFQASENAKDRALQSALAYARSGGYRGSSDEVEEEIPKDIQTAINNLGLRRREGQITQEEYEKLMYVIEGWSKGTWTQKDYANKYYTVLKDHNIYTPYGAKWGEQFVKPVETKSTKRKLGELLGGKYDTRESMSKYWSK